MTAPWRRKLGLLLLGLGMLAPVAALVIPFLGLPPALSAAATGAMLVGAPEVLLILSTVFLGKEGMQQALGRVLTALKAPAGPARYFVCLVAMAVSSLLPWILYGYLPDRMPADLTFQTRFFAASDLLFVTAFVLAGSEFWAKLARLLTWTEAESCP